MSKLKIIHREVMQLKASPEAVYSFINTPERIFDYYPSPISCGVLEPDKSFYCQGKSGVSMLERVATDTEQGDILTVTLRVRTATPFEGEITEGKIMENLFFIMYEDWQLESDEGGTRLTKTWRDIDKKKMKYLPLSLIVRHSAKGESKILVQAWDAAAEVS